MQIVSNERLNNEKSFWYFVFTQIFIPSYIRFLSGQDNNLEINIFLNVEMRYSTQYISKRVSYEVIEGVKSHICLLHKSLRRRMTYNNMCMSTNCINNKHILQQIIECGRLKNHELHSQTYNKDMASLFWQ